ncbi:MAG: type III-B CRISPR module-associated protein Cmr5 [Deltaproteobacteria bacterium]|nr:type III-B CRISPR module-associated protein Cmr5 [Deltaproteobacteria bacterium]
MPDEERNLEHKRAEYAYSCIDEIAGMGDDKQKKYRTAVLSCSAFIQKAGLMQAMAFYLSKKQNKLAEHILRWITFQRHGGNAVELFHQLLGANDEMLAAMTSDAQSLVKWLKRFAEGRLKKDEDVDSEGAAEESTEKESRAEE